MVTAPARRALAVVHMSASSLRYTPAPDRNRTLRARIAALGGGGEAHPIALLAGREPQRQRQMGLARAGVAQSQDVLSAVEILRAGQLQHQAFVHRRDRTELEGVETLQDRELVLVPVAVDSPRRYTGAMNAIDERACGKPGCDNFGKPGLNIERPLGPHRLLQALGERDALDALALLTQPR